MGNRVRVALTAAALLLAVPADGQRPPLADILTATQSLKGVKAISVAVSVAGIRDIPEETYRADLESRLQAAGITVLPPTQDPKTYPNLLLSVDADFIRNNRQELIGSMAVYTLELYQLFPKREGSRTLYYKGATWEIGGRVAGMSIGIAASLRREYISAMDDFIKDYKVANAGEGKK